MTTSEERYRRALLELDEYLPELQKCVRGCGDPKILDATYHSVIEFRRLVRSALHLEQEAEGATSAGQEGVMNVKEIVYNELQNRGCKLREEVGILYITTPDGAEWDMTIPMKKRPPLGIGRVVVAARRLWAEDRVEVREGEVGEVLGQMPSGQWKVRWYQLPRSPIGWYARADLTVTHIRMKDHK
jgi:hypothetical protein